MLLLDKYKKSAIAHLHVFIHLCSQGLYVLLSTYQGPEKLSILSYCILRLTIVSCLKNEPDPLRVICYPVCLLSVQRNHDGLLLLYEKNSRDFPLFIPAIMKMPLYFIDRLMLILIPKPCHASQYSVSTAFACPSFFPYVPPAFMNLFSEII
jgi:hypothetical protein